MGMTTDGLSYWQAESEKHCSHHSPGTASCLRERT